MHSPQFVTVDPTKLVRALGVTIGVLLVASISGLLLSEYEILQVGKKLFYLDWENNLPTYFSSMQLLIAAGLLALIATIKCREKDPMGRHWIVLAFGFLLMSVDEMSSLHEKLIKPIRALLHSSHLGIFHYAWVIPALALLIGLGIYYLKFLIAATLFLGGAVGLEMVGGKWVELHGQNNWVYYLETHVEETMEMTGILVFIRALLIYMQENHQSLGLRIQPATQKPCDGVDRVKSSET